MAPKEDTLLTYGPSDEWWIAKIQEGLHPFADQDYQERVWVEGRGPEVSSYVEACCALYDDFQFSSFLIAAERRKLVSGACIDALTRFDQALTEFGDTFPSEDPREVVKNNEWQKVVEAAKLAIELMRNIGDDEA